MGKRTAKAPLTLISPNEPFSGTRSRSRGISLSGPYQGKENGTPVRITRNTARPSKKHMETPESSNEFQQVYTSQKRARSLVIGPSPSGLRGGDQDSRREDSIVGCQTGELVQMRKNLLPDDNKEIENLHITTNADDYPSSDDNLQNGAQLPTAVQHGSDAYGDPDLQRLDRNMVPAEVAETAASVVSTKQGSLAKRNKKESVSGAAQQLGNITSPKGNRRTTVGKAAYQVLGTSRDQNDDTGSTALCQSVDLQAIVARATDTVLNAYDKLYKKHQRLKARQHADAEDAFDEQSRRINIFSTAAEDLLQDLRRVNSDWEYQENLITRSRVMEVAYIECQNDLLIERAKNLELRQDMENAKLHESKLLRELLENASQLTISNDQKSGIIFSHNDSGFEFKLQQNELSQEVGGKDALLYNVVTPGTILHVAPDWMQSEIIFDMTQVQVFFQRVLAVAHCGGA